MATPSNIRCARCSMVVLDVFNAIMQDLMQHQPISAPDLYNMIMKDKYFLKKKLNSIEIHTIQTLITDGFSKLDFSIIYKIAKYFRGLIPTPTRNWGTNPLPNEIEEGDDVERLRQKRNHMVHKVNADISEQAMNEFFATSIEIGKRLDNYLNKTGPDGHEEKIKHYQYCSMKPKTTEKYIRALQEIEFLKEKLTLKVDNKELHFYEGNSIANVVAKLNESQSLNEGDHLTPVKLIFHDVEDEEHQIELLNKLRLENNFDTENIKFISATKECIAVFVFIRTTILINSTLRSSEVTLFVQNMILSTGMMCYVEDYLSIVVVSSEDETNESRSYPSDETEEDFRKPSDLSLILNLEMRKRVMQSNESVKENFERFLGNIYERTNGNVFSHREDTPFNVVLAENDNDTIQQSLDTPHANIVRCKQEGVSEPIELMLYPRTDDEKIDRHATGRLYKKDVQTRERLWNFQKLLIQWITLCNETVKEINTIADDLDEHFQRISKAKIGGSAAGIVGGIMAAVGFGLSFVTFGAPLGLTIAGGIIAGAGGLTVGGSVATDAILSQKRKTSAEEILKRYNVIMKECKEECLEIGGLLQDKAYQLNGHSSLSEEFPYWFEFWAKLTIRTTLVCKITGWDTIVKTILASMRIATTFDDLAANGIRIGGILFKVMGPAVRGVHIAGGIVNILLIPLDIYTLVDSAIDVYKKNEHKISSSIRSIAKKIKNECPTKTEIETMIAETITRLYYFEKYNQLVLGCTS